MRQFKKAFLFINMNAHCTMCYALDVPVFSTYLNALLKESHTI
jgi:hypothetical protein